MSSQLVSATPHFVPAAHDPRPAAVHDAEDGRRLVLNTTTALQKAEARGDADATGMGASLLSAFPKLSADVESSAALHMFSAAQQQALAAMVQAEEAREAVRQEALQKEPMAWRRARMEREFVEERVAGFRQLEQLRTSQSAQLLVKARELGLL